jgi:DNA polymerase-3 subunit delta'
VSQGHIGRARALARDESVRNRRRAVLTIPMRLSDLGTCMTSAANLVDAANEEAKPRSEALAARELTDLELVFGTGSRGVRTTGFAAARKELEDRQKQRLKRMVRDAVDRSLVDLASFYRDVLCLQLDTDTALVNEELRREVATMARGTTGEVSTQRLTAIFETRELLEGEIAPLLALESLMISLRGGS